MKAVILKTIYTGTDLPHRLLWRIVEENAATARERESTKKEEWSRPALVAMVFAFHAMEAYLNYVGQKLGPEVWANEKEHFRESGFRGRLRDVMERAGLPWMPGKRPLQTVLQLKKLRDAIAHGRPEEKAGEVHHSENSRAPYPLFTLRSMFTPFGKMERAVEDVEELANEIQKNARLKLKPKDPWFRNEAFQGPMSYGDFSTTTTKRH